MIYAAYIHRFIHVGICNVDYALSKVLCSSVESVESIGQLGVANIVRVVRSIGLYVLYIRLL